ncbi:MAG: pyruvate kinase [Desulfobacterales bacterium]|nr:pyruvate kinase [Desulfobacterales bacterium]
MPKTKIVCTIGPSSDHPDIIEALIKYGMDVARLNFSHGTHEEHKKKIEIIRSVSDNLGKPVAILQDLCGPKIRVGKIQAPGIYLKPGQTLILTTEKVDASDNRVSVSYKNLPSEVKENDSILLADGMMELTVKKITEKEIFCNVITGGVLTSYKGVNLPNGSIKAPALTDKDRKDLFFGLNSDIDYVALSFVRRAEDILCVKELMTKVNKQVPVIAKIEKHEALDAIDEIIDVSDAVMVARGDLGVEIPLDRVPGIQKMIIKKSNAAGKPVIIATQMLRSMVDSPRPTRAEAADVANAVLDGTDAIMLSEETANGKYPIEAVKYMARIAETTEANFPHKRYLELKTEEDISKAVACSSCVLANNLNADAIVATTFSGSTAMRISRFRPKPKLIALSPDKTSIRKLCLYWGCNPCYVEISNDTDEMIDTAATVAIKTGEVSQGDVVVITAGHPLWTTGTTNMLWVKRL